MIFPYFSKNGQLEPIANATIPIDSIEYQYGFGVYETLKVRNGIIYFEEQHIQRLFKSTEILGLTHTFTQEDISAFLRSLIEKTISCQPSFNIKILLIGDVKHNSANIYILPLAPLFPDRKLYTNGASVNTVRYTRFLPNAKSLNMLQSYLYFTAARKRGDYDVLFTDSNDSILEGSRTNFFALKNNKILTPPAKYVLEGVTRQTVLFIAKKHGFETSEQTIPLDKISDYDGAFLTSTSSNIIPIAQINNFKFVSVPDELKKLMHAYHAFLEVCKGKFEDDSS